MAKGKSRSKLRTSAPPLDLADELATIHLAARRNELTPFERMQLADATRAAQLRYLEAQSPQAAAIARGRAA